MGSAWRQGCMPGGAESMMRPVLGSTVVPGGSGRPVRGSVSGARRIPGKLAPGSGVAGRFVGRPVAGSIESPVGGLADGNWLLGLVAGGSGSPGIRVVPGIPPGGVCVVLGDVDEPGAVDVPGSVVSGAVDAPGVVDVPGSVDEPGPVDVPGRVDVPGVVVVPGAVPAPPGAPAPA